MTQNKGSLLPIFITVFIDMLGVGIVIPILGHLFLDVNGVLPQNYTLQLRTIMLGFLIASYPLAQFFGAPILGALSDRHGRKKILILSLFGTFIGYLFFAYGVLTKNLSLIFTSRILDGFTGGNISTALSAIADISDPKEKAKNFGLIGMAFGLGVILGPFLGGKLADDTLVSWFNHSTPFFFAALLCFTNVLLVIWMFKETLMTKSHTKISLLTGIKNIKKALGMPNLRIMFIVVFLLTFGFNFFTQFWQVFLIEKFQFTQSQIGDLFAYMGLWIAFTQGGITRQVSKKLSPVQVLSFSILIVSITLPFLLLPNNPAYILLILPFIAVFNGLTHPNTTAIISNLSGKESQGEILGINQSIQSLAMSLPAIISGFIVVLHRSLPILVGSFTIFLSWLVFITLFKKEQKQLFHEV